MDLDWQGGPLTITSPRGRSIASRRIVDEETVDPILAQLVLSRLPGITARHTSELRRRGLDSLERPQSHRDLFGGAARRQLLDGSAWRRAESERRQLERLGGGLLLLGEPGYPELLAHAPEPPAMLFVRGRWPPPGGPVAAVVGSRAASPAGNARARELSAGLAQAGVLIVSGLARGIDAAAHRGALDAKGWTAAVLGTGLDRCYPAEHAALADEVAASGALISEFPLGTPPRRGHFPRRNRIIAGLARGVVVVEASSRSGALVTAGLALDAGREVMAMPGFPGAPLATGTNALIRDGARLVRDAADVALELGLEAAGQPAVGEGLLAQLRRPVGLEELVERSGRPAAALLQELTELELAARVRRLPGALYVRA
jgi:DNA processing protein